MHQMSYYYLILRYPSLVVYINRCYAGNHINDLYDFMISVETDGKYQRV